MTIQLKKELRPLLMPCLVALTAGVIAACVLPLVLAFAPEYRNPYDWRYSLRMIVPVAQFAFFACLIVASTNAFGVEFEGRTLGLLLSQAIPRNRLWWHKTIVAVTAVGTTALLCLLARIPTQAFIRSVAPNDLESADYYTSFGLLTAAFLLATVCSAGFWTLVSGSMIGGLVFNLASQFAAVVGASYLLERGLGLQGDYQEPRFAALCLGLSFVYSAVFLWLGRRVFSRIQIRDATGPAGLVLDWRLLNYRSIPLLRARPAGAWANLLRKEIALHQPVFVTCVIFVAAWLLTLGLSFLLPQRLSLCENILNILTFSFMAIVSVLVGCGSLGEEKKLGTIAWHHTLPASRRRLWLIKWLTGLGVLLIAGWALPLVLSLAVSLRFKLALPQVFERFGVGTLTIFIPSILLFALSFWSITLVRTTIRAVSDSALALLSLVACVVLGNTLASHWLDGLGELAMFQLCARYQLSPQILTSRITIYILWFTLLAVLVILMRQSYRQFRSLYNSPWTIVRHCVALGLAVVCPVLLAADCEISGAKAARDFEQVLKTVLTHHIRHEGIAFAARINEPLTLAELGKGAVLPAFLQTWLKDAKITCVAEQRTKRNSGVTVSDAFVTLPNGETFSARFSEPIRWEAGDATGSTTPAPPPPPPPPLR